MTKQKEKCYRALEIYILLLLLLLLRSTYRCRLQPHYGSENMIAGHRYNSAADIRKLRWLNVR